MNEKSLDVTHSLRLWYFLISIRAHLLELNN
jgi:hypothetical protein